jgi:hypothetical protein
MDDIQGAYGNHMSGYGAGRVENCMNCVMHGEMIYWEPLHEEVAKKRKI